MWVKSSLAWDDRAVREVGLQRVVGVDWSGRVDVVGQRRHIWAGVWTADECSTDSGTVTLENGRSRDELITWLISLAAETPRMVVGFDFSFSYPAWFLRELGISSAPEFWQSVADGQGEKWLHRDCVDGRFWGSQRRSRRSLAASTRIACCGGRRLL